MADPSTSSGQALPTGTVTFLFTDIEGSTQLLQRLRDEYAAVLADHHAILRAAFEKWNGREIDTQGDAFFVVFVRASDALAAVVGAQRALAAHAWPQGVAVRVRMALHTGEAILTESGYIGLDVHRAARIGSAGHGGQVLLSEATQALVKFDLPDGVTLRDLGEHHLKDLRTPKHLYQLVIAGLPADFPQLRSLYTWPNNLPTQLTSFIGREREIEEVKRLLSSSRLVTLTGSGGCGKTRLAIHVASELLSEFAHGVWLVDLASLADPALVPQTAATVLDVRPQGNQPVLIALSDYLRDKKLLLVLDNCEHLIEACAQLAEAILRACPGLRLLATSRETLGIEGEAAVRVPSLSLPSPQNATLAAIAEAEAAQLFVERASAALPGFALTDSNALPIAQVCRRLDGIALAIELAASRVKLLKVEQIAARLDDAFRFLTGGSRTALPRHQTLRAAIDWSYDLLAKPERVLLRRLSVFAGGWTLEVAEQVCASEGGQAGILPSEILDLLAHLVDKSLVVVDMQGGETRYRMLETIRQYARERLAASGETDAARRRHAEFFTAWVEQMGMELRTGPTQLDRFAQLEVEGDNIAAALEWSLGGADGELGLRLVSAIFYFWWRGGHWLEWGRWMALAPAHLDHVSETTRAGALVAMAATAFYVTRDNEAGRRHSREALAIYRRLGDRRNIAWAIFWLNTGSIGVADEYAQSMDLAEEAIAIMWQDGDLGGVAQGLTNLGLYAQVHGDRIRAKAAYQESLKIAREIGDQIRESIQLSNLGGLALAEGDYETAVSLYTQRLSWARQHGNTAQILSGFANLSGVLRLLRKPQRAAQLMGAMDVLSDNFGVKLQPSEQSEFNRYVALVREQLGAEAFETLRREGRAMTLEQAIAYALETGVNE